MCYFVAPFTGYLLRGEQRTMSKLTFALACCLIAGFVSTSSFALGVGDVPRPKKEKKKEEKKESPKKEEAKKSEAKPTETAEPKEEPKAGGDAVPAWAKDVES